MVFYIAPSLTRVQNNNNTVLGGWLCFLIGEEPPLHSVELNHALSHVDGPTQSQLSRPMSSGHHISMEHRLRRKHQKLNSDTDARNETHLKAKKRRKEETHYKNGTNEKKK